MGWDILWVLATGVATAQLNFSTLKPVCQWVGLVGWMVWLVVQYHQTATPHPPSRQRRRDSGESSYFGESGESGYFGESGETGELVILVTLVVQYHPTATPLQQAASRQLQR